MPFTLRGRYFFRGGQSIGPCLPGLSTPHHAGLPHPLTPGQSIAIALWRASWAYLDGLPFTRRGRRLRVAAAGGRGTSFAAPLTRLAALRTLPQYPASSLRDNLSLAGPVPLYWSAGGQTRAHPDGSTLILIIRTHALEDG